MGVDGGTAWENLRVCEENQIVLRKNSYFFIARKIIINNIYY